MQYTSIQKYRPSKFKLSMGSQELHSLNIVVKKPIQI